ncbi:enoyl-CoA hydratase/isomerase family protein [Desulfitobacterium dichloroeliminans]|nr:enoyl-CoA hydratase [Desulfitobacterium dichloroeliminans]
MEMEYKCIQCEVDNRVAKITMNVPEKMNALDARMSEELVAIMDVIEHDDNVKAVILTGVGKAFCAGGDVTIFPKLTLEQSIHAVREEGRSLVAAFTKLPKPIIAAVNGYAVGAGLSLALLSDIVISSEKAYFGAAFVNIGLIPDVGQLYFLPRLIGMQKAKELVFTGRNIDAQEAYEMGLVNKVVEQDKFEEAVNKMGQLLASKPALSMASSKALLHQSLDMGVDELIEIEGMTQGVCMQSEDCKEGISAFMNKRKPNFK